MNWNMKGIDEKWKPKHALPTILMWKSLQIATRNCKNTQVLCKNYSTDLNFFIDVLDNSMKNYVNIPSSL